MDYEESPALRVLLVLEVRIWVSKTKSLSARGATRAESDVYAGDMLLVFESEGWCCNGDTKTSVVGVCVEDEEVWLD